MPKIFEYLGLVLRFFSKEHEPIHIHAFYEKTQIKVEFIIEDGIITKINYVNVKGYKPIPKEKMKDLEEIIEVYKYDIIQMWVKFFIYKEKIKSRKITVKLK